MLKDFLERNSKKVVYTLILFIFLLLSFGLIRQYFQIKLLNSKISEFIYEDYQKTTVPDEKEKELQIKDKQLEYIRSDVLPNYPLINAEIGNASLKRAIPFSDTSGTAWFLETLDINSKYKYYLLAPLVQTELKDVTSEEYETCESFTPAVYRQVIVRDTYEDYLVLNGINCIAYGSNISVSIYKMSDGRKVPLSGKYVFPGEEGNQNLVHNGNSWGHLVGVFGTKKSVLLIQHSAKFFAFELSTGKLIDIKSYD